MASKARKMLLLIDIPAYRPLKMFFLAGGVSILPLGFIVAVLVRVYTLRTLILILMGGTFLAVGLLFRAFEGRATDRVLKGREIPICMRCNVELSSMECLRCGRQIGPRCQYQATQFCLDCALCTVCGIGFGRFYCTADGKIVCRECYDQATSLCIVHVGKLILEGKVTIQPISKRAKVIVMEIQVPIGKDAAKTLRSSLKKELIGRSLRIGETVKALGADFKIVSGSPRVAELTVDEKTRLIVKPP
jgi:hypothetical protein